MPPPVPEHQLAKAAGEPTFSTGKPCRNGHIHLRSTATGRCLLCDKDRKERWAAPRRKVRQPTEQDVARANGQLMYSTGKPCKNGHIAERYTKTGHCKDCMLTNAEKQRREHPEKASVRNKRWYAKDIERSRALARESERRKTARDPAKKLAASKAAQKRFYIAHPEAKSQMDRLYRLRKTAPFRLTRKDIEALINAPDAQCVACEAKIDLHVDHIYPLALGGNSHPLNLQLLCKSCNCSKRHTDPVKWAVRIGREDLAEYYTTLASELTS